MRGVRKNFPIYIHVGRKITWCNIICTPSNFMMFAMTPQAESYLVDGI